jgi:hypothetical protein
MQSALALNFLINKIEHNVGGMVSWGLDPTTYPPSKNLINTTNDE